MKKQNVQNLEPTTVHNFDWKILVGLIFVFIVFAISLKNNFVVWDDPRYVYENELIINPTFENLIRIFKSVVLLNFHPITMMSYWLNSLLFGMKPYSFILTNILIHIINIFLIYKLVLKLKLNTTIALFTAIIWGVHPMHVESIVWISERKDLLYTAFFLMGIICYINFLKKTNASLKPTYIFFILACLSKPMAIVFPFVLLVIDFLLEKKINLKSFLDKKIFFIISFLFFLISINLLQNGDLFGVLEKIGTSKPVTENNLSFSERTSFASYSLLIYFVKLVIPVQLHHWYVYPKIEFYTYFSILFPIILLLVLLKTNSKILKFGLLFFLINIILVLQILPNSIAMMAERYSYLSYFGLIVMIVFYLEIKLNSKILNLILLFIIVIFSFLSFKQAQNWKNTKTLWQNTFQYHPENEQIFISLLNIHKKEQNDIEIKAICQKSLDAGLKSKTLFYELAQLNIKNQEYNEAIFYLNLAQKENTDLTFKQNIYMNKAAVFGWMGKNDSSAHYINQIQKLPK